MSTTDKPTIAPEQIAHFPFYIIYPSKTNPRKSFDEAAQTELKASIIEKGIQTPLLVRPGKAINSFEIVDGERRWLIAKDLKLEQVPCIVREMSDGEAIDAQLISHLQRTNIHPMEEAEAFEAHLGKLIKENQARRKAIADLAKKIGKPESHIAQRLQLLSLSKDAQKAYKEGDITIEHATLLAKMTAEDQKRALEFLIEEEGVAGEHIVNINLFRSWIAEEISFNLSNAPWDKADGELIPGIPACTLCPKNSAFNTTLFPEAQGKGVCQDRACFKAKLEAYKVMMHKKARKEEKLPFILISTAHHMNPDEPMKIRDVKMSGRFKVVKENNRCENTKKAQWIDGPNKGKFTFVCNYSKCKKHFKENLWSSNSSDSGDYNSPQAKLRRQTAQRELNFKDELREMVMGQAIRQIIKGFSGEVPRVILEHIAGSLIPWNSDKECQEVFHCSASALRKKLPSMKQSEVAKVIVWAHLTDAFDDGQDEAITEVALALKVDLKGFEKAAISQIHQCEVCRCFEKHACEGGCSWDKKFLAGKRYICSNCTTKAKPLPADKVPVKKIPIKATVRAKSKKKVA